MIIGYVPITATKLIHPSVPIYPLHNRYNQYADDDYRCDPLVGSKSISTPLTFFWSTVLNQTTRMKKAVQGAEPNMDQARKRDKRLTRLLIIDEHSFSTAMPFTSWTFL